MDKLNFNVDKNTGKKIIAEELTETEDDDYELTDLSSNDLGNNRSNGSNNKDEKVKLIKMMFTVLIVIVIAILLIVFVTSITGGKKSYEDIENIMATAAESYFADHPDSLPKRDGGSQTVDISILVAEEKMKELSKYTDAVCTGSVKVQKVGTNYIYIPKLDCGESYSTKALYKVVRDENRIVSSGYGLYNKDGNYVFRGEQVNNYVKLDSALWRIVKINSSNNLILVRSEPLNTLVPWDDRYNQDANFNAGINNFQSSRIKEKMNELYNSNDEDITNILLSDKDKGRIVLHNSCISKRGLNQSGAEQAIECKEVFRDQYMSLLTAADFINASVDPNCTTPSSPTCQNYNYLITSSSWWLLTSVASTSSDVYIVEENSGMAAKKAMMYSRIRPVIYLNSEVMYKSGTGTAEDPYLVK